MCCCCPSLLLPVQENKKDEVWATGEGKYLLFSKVSECGHRLC